MSKRIYGPTFPTDGDNKSVSQQSLNLDFVGPLPPEYEILKCGFDSSLTNTKDTKKDDWLIDILDSKSKIPTVKARTFSMKSGGFDPEKFQPVQPSNQLSLMELNKIEKEKKEKRKRKKEKRKKEKKKKKRKRNSSSDSEKCSKHVKKAAESGITFKWDPFKSNNERKPFNRDSEIGSGGQMDNKEKSKFYGQMKSMHEQFVTSRKND